MSMGQSISRGRQDTNSELRQGVWESLIRGRFAVTEQLSRSRGLRGSGVDTPRHCMDTAEQTNNPPPSPLSL